MLLRVIGFSRLWVFLPDLIEEELSQEAKAYFWRETFWWMVPAREGMGPVKWVWTLLPMVWALLALFLDMLPTVLKLDLLSSEME